MSNLLYISVDHTWIVIYMDKCTEIEANEIFERIKNLAIFARSVLHLPFPDLEIVNPSFAIIAKTCDLLTVILDEHFRENEKLRLSIDLSDTMRDIAEAIISRDNASIIDSMAILDEFLENTNK